MSRRWIWMTLLVLPALAPSMAEAGRGRLRPHDSMTPNGPIPGGVSLPAYAQMVQQRQMLMQQELLLRQRQAMVQQQLKAQQQARAPGRARRHAPPTLQPPRDRDAATRPGREEDRDTRGTARAGGKESEPEPKAKP